MILMKKEYLKAFTFANFMRILNELLDLVLLQNSKSLNIPLNLNYSYLVMSQFSLTVVPL